jgi:hypothetical protein
MSSSSTGLPTPEAPGSAFLGPHRDRHATALETGAGS